MSYDISGRLADTYLFGDLGIDEQQVVSEFSEYMDLSDGEYLIAEHDVEPDLYLLIDGSVEIISSENDITSEEIVLSNEDKDILGEIGWLGNGQHSASVKCQGNVEAIRVDGKRLTAFIDKHPETGALIYKKIATLLADRLMSTDTLLKQILWNSSL